MNGGMSRSQKEREGRGGGERRRHEFKSMQGGGGGGSESGVSPQLQKHREGDKENDRVASEKQNEMSGLGKK